MLILLGILLIIFLGILITLSIDIKLHLVERLGLSYVLGLGFQTFFMFLIMVAGFKLTLPSTIFVETLLVLFFIILSGRKIKSLFRESIIVFRPPAFTLVEKIMVIMIICLFIYSLVFSLYWPIADWDALALYDFRAKIISVTGSMEEGIGLGYFFGYPLLTSLANVYIYLLGGDNPKLIYSLFYIAFVFMFYGSIRRFSQRSISLLSSLLLVSTPALFNHSMVVYSNLPYTVYFVMGTIYLFIWMKANKDKYLYFAAMMIGLSTWTRSIEPFWLVSLITVILFSLKKRNILWLLSYGIIFFLIQQPWKIFESKMLGGAISTQRQFTNAFDILFSGIDFERFWHIFVYLYRFVISSWQPLIFLFMAIVLINIVARKFKDVIELFLPIIGNFLFLVAGTYVFTFNYLTWESIPGSVERMSMFFLPLFLFYIFSSKVTQKIKF